MGSGKPAGYMHICIKNLTDGFAMAFTARSKYIGYIVLDAM